MALFRLLQISVTEAPQVAEPVASTDSMSLLELLAKGGVIMVPLLLLSFLAIYVIVERWMSLSKAIKNSDKLLNAIKSQVLKGDISGAQSVLSQQDSAIARLLSKGVAKIGTPVKQIETTLENAGRLEVMKLEKNLGILSIVASIAPMLGFVGTISGVIKIFYNISLADNISIGLIAGGLYEKMVTSATGLIIGMIAYTGYHFLNMKIEKVIFELESTSTDFIELLTEQK